MPLSKHHLITMLIRLDDYAMCNDGVMHKLVRSVKGRTRALPVLADGVTRSSAGDLVLCPASERANSKF